MIYDSLMTAARVYVRSRLRRTIAHGALKTGLLFLLDFVSFLKGLRFPDHLSWPWQYRLQMLLEHYERDTLAALRKVLRPGMNVVDAGAHIGYFSRHCARLVSPGGRIFSFEPHPDNAALARHNTKRYRNCIVIQKALGDTMGTSLLYVASSSGDHSLAGPRQGHAAPIPVEVVTLDDFLESAGNPPVHLVKLDVEGYEPHVLRGMETTLSRNTDIILICEYCPAHILSAGLSRDQYFTLLKSYGFNIFVIGPNGTLHNLQSLNHLTGKQYANLFCARKNSLLPFISGTVEP